MTLCRRVVGVVLVWLVVVPVVVLGAGHDAAAGEPVVVPAVVAGERVSGTGSFGPDHGGLRVGFAAALPDICDEPRFANVGICAGGSSPAPNTPPTPTPTPEPTATPAPDYGQLKADAYIEAFDDLTNDIPEPRMRLWPAADQHQIVNLDTYLYVESGWENIAGQGEACDTWTPTACVTVWFNGEPEQSWWSFVEANSVNPPVEFDCERGERQPGDPNGTPLCGKTWTNSSDITGDVTTEMFIRYDITVTTTHAAYRPYLNYSFDADSPQNDTETLTIAEVQTYGHSDAEPVPEKSNDGLCSKWGISFICWVGDKAKDAAIWAVVNLVPGLEDVWNFFKGCADGALEALGGVLEILTTIKDAVSRPADFATEKLQQVQDLYDAATSDTEAFIAEVLSGVLDLDYLETHTRAEWVGKMACQYAIDILTGKASATILAKVNQFLGRGTPGNNGPNNDNDTNNDTDNDNGPNNDNDTNNDNDNDTDGTVCATRSSSFPTGTHVRMATGTLVAIEDIQPGDYVLAADPATDQWSPQLVLTQWSYLDTDNMTTAVLDDGTTITATDHHRFWIESDAAWVELEHTQPGDYLLSPNGAAQITQVTTHPQTETLVWELDTDGPDTFTVHTGTHDLLVHNNNAGGCGTPGSDAHREAQWEQAQDSGLTRAEFDERYDELGLNVDKIPDGAEVVSFDPVTGQPVVYKGPDGRYVDIRTPEQLQARGREIVGDAGDRSIALGRQADTDLAPGQGDFHLAVTDWSQELNDTFIDDIIINDVPIRVVSNPDLPENLFRNLGQPDQYPTVFNLELQQLRDAGIEIVYDPYS